MIRTATELRRAIDASVATSMAETRWFVTHKCPADGVLREYQIAVDSMEFVCKLCGQTLRLRASLRSGS